MEFETLQDLATWLKNNENHELYEDLCDEWAIILAHKNQQHNHEIREMAAELFKSSHEALKAFSIWLAIRRKEDLDLSAIEAGEGNWDGIFNKDFVPFMKEANPEMLEDIERAGFKIIPESGIFMCPHDIDIQKKIYSQLEFINKNLAYKIKVSE